MYSELTSKIDNIGNDISNFKKDVKQRFDKLENVVTKIEIDHGNKLSALFDCQKQLNDKFDRIEEVA